MSATLFLLLLVQPVWALPEGSASKELQRKLHTRVENYTLSEDSFLQALAKVSSQFEIPMGIEWVKGSPTKRSVRISRKSATIYQIIESLVKSQFGYEFQVKNGIMHVFPRGALTDRRNVLNLRIRGFDVQDEFVAFASRRLRNLVRRDTAVQHPSKPGKGKPDDWSPGAGSGGSVAAGLGDERISLTLHNVRVRDILDRLSLATGLKIWVVTYPERFRISKGGFRQTAALHTDKDVADEEQPLWVFLPWGVKPQIR